MYAERFFLPIKHYALEKLRFKKPKWYYMVRNFRKSIDKKIEKEIVAINPDKFLKEKVYILFVLEQNSANKK